MPEVGIFHLATYVSRNLLLPTPLPCNNLRWLLCYYLSKLLLVIRFVSAVAGLNCYKCESDVSWDDCETVTENVTCPSENYKRCSKIYYESRVFRTFTKFCERADQCNRDKNPICKAAKEHDRGWCAIDCCKGDLCNPGSIYGISNYLLACAITALAFK